MTDKPTLTYTLSEEAWYAESTRVGRERHCKGEMYLSAPGPGEATFRLMELGRQNSILFNIFDEAWEQFLTIPGFTDMLTRLGETTWADLRTALEDIGFVDVTPRENPYPFAGIQVDVTTMLNRPEPVYQVTDGGVVLFTVAESGAWQVYQALRGKLLEAVDFEVDRDTTTNPATVTVTATHRPSGKGTWAEGFGEDEVREKALGRLLRLIGKV